MKDNTDDQRRQQAAQRYAVICKTPCPDGMVAIQLDEKSYAGFLAGWDAAVEIKDREIADRDNRWKKVTLDQAMEIAELRAKVSKLEKVLGWVRMNSGVCHDGNHSTSDREVHKQNMDYIDAAFEDKK